MISSEGKKMTLDKAIEKVLREKGRDMTTTEIAQEINGAGLYHRKDGLDVQASQISARVNHHRDVFVRRDGRIGLK